MSGINVKDLSLENVLPHIVYCTKINVSLNHKGGVGADQLPPNYR